MKGFIQPNVLPTHSYLNFRIRKTYVKNNDDDTSSIIEDEARTATSTTPKHHQSSKKKRKNNPTIKWIACTSTKEANRAITMYIKEGDVVAELGSQLRETSTTICDTIGSNGKAYLVDIERKYPNVKMKREERTTAMRREGDDSNFYQDRAVFSEIESFDSWRHALFLSNNLNRKEENRINTFGKYNALVVDMSTIAGNDLELTCVSLVKEFIALNKKMNEEVEDEESYQTNPCRVVIVKSGSLHQLARRLFHAQRLFANTVSLEDNPHKTSIIGTVGVEEYRRTIPYAVRKGDAVIEVGSHFGTSTAILHDAAAASSDARNQERDDCNFATGISDLSLGGCLGVDVGPHIIDSAKMKFPHVPFVVGDAWKISDLIQFKKEYFEGHSDDHRYDVVYVDVGGLSGNEGLLEALSLLGSITNCLEPRCIVIKSLCIRRLASSLVPFSQLWKQEKAKEKIVD